MRLQNYLNEKYMTTVHQKFRDGDFEVFENPSKKELRELVDMDGGYRFIVDHKDKKFYAFSMNMFHETFFKRIDFRLTWNQYWTNGKGIEQLYTGAYNGMANTIESDSMDRFGAEPEKFGKQIQKLLKQDWKWVNKYIDTDKAVPQMVNVLYRAGLVDFDTMKDYFK